MGLKIGQMIYGFVMGFLDEILMPMKITELKQLGLIGPCCGMKAVIYILQTGMTYSNLKIYYITRATGSIPKCVDFRFYLKFQFQRIIARLW